MEADHPEIHGFSLRYQDGWAVLIVPPEDRRPRPVYADDVAARMRILDIPPVPAKRLRDIIDAGSGRPERLVEWPAGASLNAVVSVAVDEDGMAAWATATAARPGGSGLDRTAVREALSRAGVTSGLDKTALRRLLDPKNAGERLPVARGRAVVPGKPSRTDCLFVTERGKPWKELAGGRVDLKELHFIQNRKAGDLLARFVDAVPPKDGYDVFGTVIPAEPIPEGRRLRAGGPATADGQAA